MPITTTNFIRGRMNKSVDERLLPPGEYIDALNVRLGSTETTEIGAVENSKGNTQLTTLEYDGAPLSSSARCIGAFEDGALETIYWFVHDPANPQATGGVVDMIVSYNSNTDTVVYHVVTLETLNFDPAYLVTGVDKIENLLFFTDDKNPPRRINVLSNYPLPTGNTDNTVEEDLSVIVKIPGYEDVVSGNNPLVAPEISLLTLPGGENYLENKFVSFAYRYRYENNEYSAVSLFSKPAFQPGNFRFDTKNYSNSGMKNIYNGVNVEFSTGSKRVKQIDLLFKLSNTNEIYVIERFKKSDFGWGDDTTQTYTFTNSKIYTVLPSDELLRLFDNVPKTAKAQTIMGNRLMYGNYVDGYDITNEDGQNISMDFSTEHVVENVQFVELDSPALSNGDTYTIDPSNSTTITNSKITFDFSGNVSLLKKNATVSFIIRLEHAGLSGTDTQSCYTDNANFATENFEVVANIVLQNTYTSIFDFTQSTEFNNGIGTVLNESFQPIATADEGGSMTDQFNDLLVPPSITCTFTKELSGIDSSTVQQGFRVTSSTANDEIGIQPIAMKYNSVTGPTDMYEYFRVTDGSCSITTTDDTSSLHSNRDYETGIVYMDEYGRSSTVLVSEYNTIYVPPANSVSKNLIRATVNNFAPSWAKKYKFVVKPSEQEYETIYSNTYYTRPSDNTTFFKLEGDNINKVTVGESLIVKVDTNGPLSSVVKSKVLGVNAQERDFLASANELGINSNQLPGVYMEMKPSNFVATIDDDSIIDNGLQSFSIGDTSTCNPDLNVAYQMFTFTGDGSVSDPYVTTNYDIPGGSIIDINITVEREQGNSGCEERKWQWRQQYVSSTQYDDFRKWWIGDNIDPEFALPGDLVETNPVKYYSTVFTPDQVFDGPNTPVNNGSNVPCFGFGTVSFGFCQATPGDVNSPLYFVTRSGTPGCYKLFGENFQSQIKVEIVVTRADNTIIFETEPTTANSELFFDSSIAYDVVRDNVTGNYLHQSTGNTGDQNQTNAQPAIVTLPFANCYTFGNGVESFKIEDNIAGRAMVLGQRTLAVSQQDFAEADRFAEITYSGVYSSNSNVNNLNEFNLGLANFKLCETSFGPIQILYGRETDILCLQEDRISYVLANKNLISDSTGGGTIASVPEILGTQIARPEEYGISFNPESFAVYGDEYYFTDTKRLAVIQLKGRSISDRLTVLSDLGMRSWFRDEFQVALDTQKLGGYDPYMNEYVLTTNTIKVPRPPVILQCGSTYTQTATDETISYTIDYGDVIADDVTIEYDVTGTVTIDILWNGITYSSGPVTGTGTFAFDKTANTPTTAVITITPQAPTRGGYTITPLCPETNTITVITAAINSVESSGKFVHVEYFWEDSNIISPVSSNQVTFENNPLLFSYYDSQTGVRSQGVFPYDGASITMRVNKVNFDNYNWSYPDDNFKFLVSNTLYTNTQADVSSLLAAATQIPNASVTNPSPNIFEATVGPITVPPISLPLTDQYLYLIYDFRTSSAAQLCFDSDIDDACCLCDFTCTAFSGSTRQSSSTVACNQPTGETYYHNGSGTLPSVGDIIFLNSSCQGLSTVGEVLGAGFYKAGSSNFIEVNTDGVVISFGSC